jgi:hypothetical protein
MVDQPARGRSPWLPDVDGKLATFTAEQVESRFTAAVSTGESVWQDLNSLANYDVN